LLFEDSYLLEGLQSADKTKMHPKAKLQNAPLLQWNRSHSHVCLLSVIKIKTCAYQLCKQHSADTNVLIGQYWLSADHWCISSSSSSSSSNSSIVVVVIKDSNISACAKYTILVLCTYSNAVCSFTHIRNAMSSIMDIVGLIIDVFFLCSNVWQMSICLLWPTFRRKPIYPQQWSLATYACAQKNITVYIK